MESERRFVSSSSALRSFRRVLFFSVREPGLLGLAHGWVKPACFQKQACFTDALYASCSVSWDADPIPVPLLAYVAIALETLNGRSKVIPAKRPVVWLSGPWGTAWLNGSPNVNNPAYG